MTDTQLNSILTIVQQQTMVDMSAFETKEQYIELTRKADTVANNLRAFKAEIKGVSVAEAKQLAKQFIRNNR